MEFPELPFRAFFLRRGLLISLGALGGFAYYFFIGCTGGTCPISSNPWASTAYGAVIGFVLTMPKKFWQSSGYGND